MKRVPDRLKPARLTELNRFLPRRLFKLGPRSKGAVVLDKKGVPRLFVFDTFAFLDILSKIDESLVDRLTTEEYHDPSANPAGWLIDKIEAKLPLNPRFLDSLRRSIAEAERKGWIPMAEIEKRLGLA